MARSIATILSQIDRLQRQAASIQSEVVTRIRKDIAKFGLTAEQLFGDAKGKAQGPKGSTKGVKSARPVKYADGAGNTWGGFGKRPDWVRAALAAGKSLEDLLVKTGRAAKAAASGAKAVAPSPKPAAKAPRKRAGGNVSGSSAEEASPAAKRRVKPAAAKPTPGKKAAPAKAARKPRPVRAAKEAEPAAADKE